MYKRKKKPHFHVIQHSDILHALTLSELKEAIKHLSPLKAPGSDLFTAPMVQEMSPEGLHTLLYIQCG